MTQSPTIHSLRDLQRLTPARVGLGRRGASLPTKALLGFTLDHARARDAVHAPFDRAAMAGALEALGMTVHQVQSRAEGRHDYLVRPDLGRQLDPGSRDRLGSAGGTGGDLVLVIGDGLSPGAVHARAAAVVARLLPRLAEAGINVGAAVVATGARVALGDEIGALLGARIVAVLIGERPGLSAPASLGAYVTYAPRSGLTDAERNCVSNVHAAGLTDDEAAFKIGWLIREGLVRRLTGVALKDDSMLGAANTAPELSAPG